MKWKNEEVEKGEQEISEGTDGVKRGVGVGEENAEVRLDKYGGGRDGQK